VPVAGPPRNLDSAVELLEHVGEAEFLPPSISHQLLKVIDQTVGQ
jgi:hypothetical protein